MTNLSLWTRRDPFAEFDAIVRNTFGPTGPTNGSGKSFIPAAEIHKDGDDAVVRLELPGVDVDKDVVVELDRGRLVVKGERREEKREGQYLREVRYGSFQRSFGVPSHVKADAVSATYDAGVLEIRVAGAYAGTEAQRIAVSATAGEQQAAIEA